MNAVHPSERLARIEERVDQLEEELDSISSKVTEMHAILLQAKGVRWIIGLTIGAVTLLAGITHWKWIWFLGFLLFTPAFADGPPGPGEHRPHPADWINQQSRRNAAGEWCCGPGDCFEIAPVRVTAQGYLLMVTGETVPFSEAQPSPDGKYWRCQRPDGSRRCFFAPPPSM